jgi:hypothetical protein
VEHLGEDSDLELFQDDHVIEDVHAIHHRVKREPGAHLAPNPGLPELLHHEVEIGLQLPHGHRLHRQRDALDQQVRVEAHPPDVGVLDPSEKAHVLVGGVGAGLSKSRLQAFRRGPCVDGHTRIGLDVNKARPERHDPVVQRQHRGLRGTLAHHDPVAPVRVHDDRPGLGDTTEMKQIRPCPPEIFAPPLRLLHLRLRDLHRVGDEGLRLLAERIPTGQAEHEPQTDEERDLSTPGDPPH